MANKNKFINFFKKNWIILLILLVLLVLFYYSYSTKGIIHAISTSDNESVVNFIESFGVFSYIAFILLVILECVLAPIPALALYVTGGALFGTFLGSILALIGNLIGALVAFWIARRFGRKFVEKRVDENMRKKFDKFSEKYGGFSLFLLRVNPLTTSDLFSYLAGLTKIKIRTFLLGTGLGLIPMIFIQAYFGEAFVKDYPTLYVFLILISVAYLLVFFYLMIKMLLKPKKTS
jgi:uncharacterized membrane protein YdjX (TVP38/TMEM64 family)